MRDDYLKFLSEGSERGSAYSLCMRQGFFEGGTGGKLGARSGNSLEFMEHRNYMPGDDLRTLDWNVYARTEKLTVKLFREEINPRLDIVIDASGSMALPDSGKDEAAFGLTGMMSSAAENSSFQVRAWIMRETLLPFARGNGIVENPGAADFHGVPDFSAVSDMMQGRFYHHGVRILISDLLWMTEPRRFMHRFSAGAAAVIILQVMGREDISPGEYGNIRLEDVETGSAEELFVDAASLHKYSLSLARHQGAWERACRECGASLITLEAEKLIEKWDLEELIKNEIIRMT